MNPSNIIKMASAFYDSCVLFAASDLGVFAKLAELGKADAIQIADSCNLDPRGARLLLDACVALELLVKEGETYRNSQETAMFLVPGARGDLSGAIRYNRDVYNAWGQLKKMAQTGKPVEKPEVHLGGDRERTRTFVMAMHGRAMGIGRAVVPQVDLGGCEKLLDIGGGPGTYSVLLAKANPGVKCVVLDLPEIVNIADELIRGQGMQERVTTLAGDYHEAKFPGGNDAVILFGVLHQESPESIKDLLARVYDALVPGGRVYVLDMMTDDTRTRPAFSAMFAVNMALTTENGWVFSDRDMNGWLSEAGFVSFECQSLPQPMPHWLVIAKKP